MTSQQAARLKAAALSFEYHCERCKKRPAVTIFDQYYVCARCRRVLDERLRKEGLSAVHSHGSSTAGARVFRVRGYSD